MAVAAAPIAHDQQLTLVEHLDELRWRVMISVAALVVAFGLALWQNNALLDILNRPLTHATAQAAAQRERSARRPGAVPDRPASRPGRDAAALGRLSRSRAPLAGGDRRALAAAAAANAAALRAAPKEAAGRQPVTLGLAEPFTQTLTVAGYFALLFSLPIILFQAYAFLLPAFSPRDRRVAVPLMAMVPVLFASAWRSATRSCCRPPSASCRTSTTGSSTPWSRRAYYGFTIMTLAAMGLLFQIPVAILALTRLGVSPRASCARTAATRSS